MQAQSLPDDLFSTAIYHFCNIAATVAANTTIPSKNELTTIPEELIAGRVFLQSLTHYFPSIARFPFSSLISPLLSSNYFPFSTHSFTCEHLYL